MLLLIILKRSAYQDADGAELFTCIYSPKDLSKVSYYNAKDSL
jgi:hypothetical protein